MTQVLTDRATLEQIVVALNEVDQHVDLKRYDTAPNEVLFDVVMAALAAGRAALANAEPTGWQKIETAPKDKSVMLHCRGFIPFYCGRKRYGNLGEPQQSELAWRCDSSGRFANPTHWMPLPTPPKDTL